MAYGLGPMTCLYHGMAWHMAQDLWPMASRAYALWPIAMGHSMAYSIYHGQGNVVQNQAWAFLLYGADPQWRGFREFMVAVHSLL